MKKFSVALLILAFALPVSGCCLIGFGFGAAADAEQPGIRIHLPAGLDSLPAGSDVQIFTLGQKSITARYISKGLGSDGRYAERFQRWRDSLTKQWRWVPAYGSQISILAHNDQKHLIFQGRFAGFGSGVVLLESPPGSDAIGTSLECIDAVRDSAKNTLVDKQLIDRTFASGVPNISDVTVPSIILAGPTRSVPFADIDSLVTPISGSQKWIGFAVGAVIDVAVATLAVTGAKEMRDFDILKLKITLPFNPH